VVGNLALELEKERPQAPGTGAAPEDFDSLITHGRARELTRGLAQALIETVYVYGDSSVRVRFRSSRHIPGIFVSEGGVRVVTEGSSQK
jgi:predicted ribosome quality control (RQC) complex YloA/Tae2 family protein